MKLLIKVNACAWLLYGFGVMLLSACSTQPVAVSKKAGTATASPSPSRKASPKEPSIAPKGEPTAAERDAKLSPQAQEVVLYALGLLNIDYRFGGKNPESGLDCSGMVSYVFEGAVGIKLPHNAAQIAREGREVERQALLPGDLVFFNTRNRPFSHVGIYIGEDRFIHAPSTNGQIKVSSLNNRYFASRYEAARRYFD
ncbi:cell wall-associated NlpC family hydrolase [Chitinivorax tropicus]|uniref:Cell wall-associated NlpC family hydrolase n=1 Tax=Chitinivorax tropicus TaxID=714531 RepID=A0A840MVT4_9PROT|nr:C40 family peptidase [Chitinivorax tropicus]MBB5020436.1 cell wall-associated NlpC family hydrolase [Chitinivorax tropicus]